jgi:hypothetical protein
MIQCVRYGSCKRSIGGCNRSFPCSLSRSCSRTGGTISTQPMWRTGCLSWRVASLCRAAPTHAGSAGCRMQRNSLPHMLTSGLSLQLSGAGEPAQSRRWRGTRTTWVLSERAPFDPITGWTLQHFPECERLVGGSHPRTRVCGLPSGSACAASTRSISSWRTAAAQAWSRRSRSHAPSRGGLRASLQERDAAYVHPSWTGPSWRPSRDGHGQRRTGSLPQAARCGGQVTCLGRLRLMAALLSMIYGSARQLAHRAHEVFLGWLRVDRGGVDVHVPGEALDQADVARLAIEIRTRGVA